MADRLTKAELHDRFVAAVGPGAVVLADTDAAGELVVELHSPLPRRVRVYIYNATDAQGPLRTLEHRIQLILTGQSKAERANFDRSGVDLVLLCGYAPEHDTFVFWDASLHLDFPHSKNLQVRSENVVDAASAGVTVRQERHLRSDLETVICAPSRFVADAIAERFASPILVPQGLDAETPTGQPYMRPPRSGGGESALRVFSVDPDVIDRGTNAHKDVQDQLADAVSARGWEPLSPSGSDPLFDIGWIVADTAWIAEVKSLTESNEDRQLRLGLGQVLSYAYLVDWGAAAYRPVLAVEREPSSPYWPGSLCITWCQVVLARNLRRDARRLQLTSCPRDPRPTWRTRRLRGSQPSFSWIGRASSRPSTAPTKPSNPERSSLKPLPLALNRHSVGGSPNPRKVADHTEGVRS